MNIAFIFFNILLKGPAQPGRVLMTTPGSDLGSVAVEMVSGVSLLVEVRGAKPKIVGRVQEGAKLVIPLPWGCPVMV